jgi:hypothetical protein
MPKVMIAAPLMITKLSKTRLRIQQDAEGSRELPMFQAR